MKKKTPEQELKQLCGERGKESGDGEINSKE